MKLYIKEKVFSWGDKFTVKDASGSDKYVVEAVASQLDSFENDSDGYRILLSHRPELFDAYISAGMDLVFTGHAHGGQIRLPFLGGLVAPNQGFFLKYDAGLFTQGQMNMIVSRGVGNSIIPVRVLNRPEVAVVQLANPNGE